MLRRACALLVLGAAGLGCGGIGPGDYVLFRVGFSEQEKKTKGCYGPSGAVPANEGSDKTNFRGSSLFIIYGATEDGEDKLFLDTGETTIDGYEEAGGFIFTGNSTDVDFTEVNGAGDKHTTTNKLLIELTIDGASMVGSAESTVKQTCSGTTCDLTLPAPINCVTTTTFVGTEIEDVELHHDI